MDGGTKDVGMATLPGRQSEKRGRVRLRGDDGIVRLASAVLDQRQGAERSPAVAGGVEIVAGTGRNGNSRIRGSFGGMALRRDDSR